MASESPSTRPLRAPPQMSLWHHQHPADRHETKRINTLYKLYVTHLKGNIQSIPHRTVRFYIYITGLPNFQNLLKNNLNILKYLSLQNYNVSVEFCIMIRFVADHFIYHRNSPPVFIDGLYIPKVPMLRSHFGNCK